MTATQADIDWAKKWIIEYRKRQQNFEKKVKNCKPSQKGAYKSHAIQAARNANRWEKTLREWEKGQNV